MKKLFICTLIILLTGCVLTHKEICKKGLPEKHYDFLTDLKRQPDFDYLGAIVDFRQFGSYSNNLWIRKAENLKLVYSSLKQIGLEKFISNKEFNKPLFTNHWAETCWENKSLNQILQNLIKSHSDTTGFDKYYIEFWERRKADENETVVFQILQNIDKTYNSASSPEKLNWEWEPKIVKLYEYEIELKQSDSSTIKNTNIEYFNFLKDIGLYSSANNLIQNENEVLFNKSQNRDHDYLEAINQLETDSVSCDEYWNWRQSATWFTEIYDYGP